MGALFGYFEGETLKEKVLPTTLIGVSTSMLLLQNLTFESWSLKSELRGLAFDRWLSTSAGPRESALRLSADLLRETRQSLRSAQLAAGIFSRIIICIAGRLCCTKDTREKRQKEEEDEEDEEKEDEDEEEEEEDEEEEEEEKD